MNTALFGEDMTEEMKERISFLNKKFLKEKTKEYLHDILWILTINKYRHFM